MATVPADWRRIAIGAYVDADGDLHLVVPELLTHLGVADTPGNRDRMTRIALDALRGLLPDADVTLIE